VVATTQQRLPRGDREERIRKGHSHNKWGLYEIRGNEMGTEKRRERRKKERRVFEE